MLELSNANPSVASSNTLIVLFFYYYFFDPFLENGWFWGATNGLAVTMEADNPNEPLKRKIWDNKFRTWAEKNSKKVSNKGQ